MNPVDVAPVTVAAVVVRLVTKLDANPFVVKIAGT
jgi:hypothetical protein